MDQNQESGFAPSPFQPKPRKKAVWPWVLLGSFVLIVVLLIVGIIAVMEDGEEGGEVHRRGDRYVAVLHIGGTIAAESDGVYSHEYVTTQLKSFIEDKDNAGLVLAVDSPGGELYAVDEVYELLLAYKATERPVYAYCGTYAASGGYYLASAADYIAANRMSTVGSIGVIYGYHIDLTGLCEKAGVKVTTIASDENKSMGGMFSPLTDEQKAIFQSQLDEYYGAFVDVVAAGRTNLTREQIVALADGRTYTAKQAKDSGLIDGIMTYTDFLGKVKTDLSVDDSEIEEYRYTYNGVNPLDLLDLLGEAAGNPASLTADELSALAAALSRFRGPMVLYGLN